ncbi:hypothetical protein pEaSNUABM54_00187 [Erwinia phage pEa_SNUABM_54]|nr:hypothetical protein pEaSNUABM54_00187 [Erwinia phage pEa_SNUABM_54]
MAHVDYNVVVQELLKGLAPLDSPIVKAACMTRAAQLSEYRTIRFGGGRQTGKTKAVIDIAAKSPDTTLIISPDRTLGSDLVRRWREECGDLPFPTMWTNAFYDENGRRGRSPMIVDGPHFDTIIIDEAGLYFAHYKHASTYKGLAGVSRDNAVVYLVG